MLLTAVAVVPESQRWTLGEPHRSQMARGLAWAAQTPPKETDVVASLARLRDLDWNSLYRHTGYNWELIDHVKGPGGAKVYSLPLSQKMRAVGYRNGEYLRLVSLHPDHDSAYGR